MMRSAAGCLTLGVFTALLAACGKPPATAPVQPALSSPPPVATNAPAAPARPPQLVLPETVATIVGSENVAVKSSQTGYLVRQAYKDGAQVNGGDLLFLLDPRTTHDGARTDKSALVRIASPVAGFPGHAWHGPGDWVDPNMELTSVARVDEMAAELTLPDPLARQFIAYFDQQAHDPELHKDFELILPDGNVYIERGYAGTMPSDGTIHVLSILFPNPGHILLPGELVKVRSVMR